MKGRRLTLGVLIVFTVALICTAYGLATRNERRAQERDGELRAITDDAADSARRICERAADIADVIAEIDRHPPRARFELVAMYSEGSGHGIDVCHRYWLDDRGQSVGNTYLARINAAYERARKEPDKTKSYDVLSKELLDAIRLEVGALKAELSSPPRFWRPESER